ncbi:MAG TPA: hypothetical protein IAC35_00545 [Candidatus Cryptobacteroides merdipullorum]|uniref:Peptidyl-prolyl cis-trans isomerase n=1 Tax=Candidatus Cryptobacteroides merdipullorum TaxID=2840771 RepID=A0A9D1KGT3_9BACT|nr:hypothetical protein [Candidatus Cryptobacteroides merdipullorum]
MRTFPYLLAAAFLLLTPLSCDVASSLVHDDQPVAKVGREKLYRSEVESMIPDMISPEDSAGIAEKYIRLWAMDRLYMKVAEEQLSKSEIDVSDELESYRRSLVRYRYEQRYLNDRLDTLITDAQIREYYLANQEDFELSRPLLKLRFVDVMKDSPDKDEILRLMSSDEYDELELADSLAGKSALRYFDNSDSWMDAGELSRYFGVTVEEMLDAMDEDMIVIEPEGRGDILAAYVCDMINSGTAPLEYCSPAIRDIILSNRKHELMASLERDLLEGALDSKQLVIY